ncbi:MAG TPA: DUF4124 domain-containing protein [Steroidobacteraceae bacterium]|jgi:hypothetical protein|nr:DUF4124 domain-containing protein [Steroidobacteraceae bacterium]
MLRHLPIALLLAGAAAVAQADVYRWVDEHGQPHYSDQWVPGSEVIKTAKVHPGSTTIGEAPPGQKSQAPAGNSAAAAIADTQNTRAVQQDVGKAHDAQCKAAQARYAAAVQSRRVFKEGKDGEREYLSDAEAETYRENARKDVQIACGNVPQFDPNAPIAEPKAVPEPKVNPADATSN